MRSTCISSKKYYAVLAALALSAFGAGSYARADALIDPTLQGFAQQGPAGQVARVIAILPNEVPGLTVPRRYDRPNVLAYLHEVARVDGQNLESYLRGVGAWGTSVHPRQLYWINTSFVADVTPEGLKALARAPGVSKIYANRKINREPTLRGRLTPPTGRGFNGEPSTYAAKDTGLDRLRAEDPRHDGSGVFIGSVDTGVDGKHPALAGKIPLFYDAEAKKRTEPFDKDEHGTHTAGTMVGGDGKDNQIGVAPGAKLIATAALTDYPDMLEGMQWMLNPDGSPNGTNDKIGPRAINNSWNCGGAPDVELFYRAIGAWEAAGILPVFSAGNSGPRPQTITQPHEHPSTFAIGATAEGGRITNYSSRGPGVYHGQQTQKPDITAPGDTIRSSLPGGKYGEMSGTSMATPHVTGTTALLWQVKPDLTPLQVRKILVASSLPVDANGNPGKAGDWNANYGFGRLNIYNAVHLTMQLMQSQFMGRPLALTALEVGSFFEEPSAQDLQGVLQESAEPMTGQIVYPAAFEQDGVWIRASNLWGAPAVETLSL